MRTNPKTQQCREFQDIIQELCVVDFQHADGDTRPVTHRSREKEFVRFLKDYTDTCFAGVTS